MIDMQASAEQQQIVDSVAQVLAAKFPLARYRRAQALPSALDEEILQQGWIGLGLPEDLGGVGYGIVEEMLACREFGRQLAPLPLFASMLGARCAAAAGDAPLARRIIAGEARVAVALRVHALAADAPLHVLDAAGADLILGFTPGALLLLPAADIRLAEGLPAMDPTGAIATGAYIGMTPPRQLEGRPFWEALLLGSALLVGMAEATRDMAVAYAKQREQFGQAIGAFQAVKHICADSALRAEAARSHLFYAAIQAQDGSELLAMHATAAKLTAADAALLNAAANIQVHGGMGFTAECDAHLYVKRAHVLEQLLGPQRSHQSALGRGGVFPVR